MRVRRLFTFLLTLVLVVVAGCGRKEAAETTTDTASPVLVDEASTATSPASPGGTAVVPDVSAGTTAIVVVEDGSIGVTGQAIPAGPVVFTVENGGSQVHNLFIEGEGISRTEGNSLAPKETKNIDVILRPGTYTLYCPVLDHRTKGEQTTITIPPPGA